MTDEHPCKHCERPMTEASRKCSVECRSCHGRCIHVEMLIDRLKKRIAELEAGIVLTGWWCVACKVFNGAAKEILAECRSCGAKKP